MIFQKFNKQACIFFRYGAGFTAQQPGQNLPCTTVKNAWIDSRTEIPAIKDFEISILNKYKNKCYTTFAVHRKSDNDFSVF